MALLRRWNTILFFELDRTKIIHDQILNGIIREIKNGHLEAGMLLPSYRELANLLKVNRNTIAQVYEELTDRGILRTERRKGTFVSEGLLPKRNRLTHLIASTVPSHSESNFSYNKFPEPIVSSEIPPGHWKIKFDDGYPDPHLAPSSKFISAYKRMSSRSTRQKKSDYDGGYSYYLLAREICNMLRNSRGLNLREENICTIHSTRMALYMVARVILLPGDNIVVEDPGSSISWQTFEQVGASLIPISVDDEGISTTRLEQICNEKKIKAVFVTPGCQYPTTVTLSQQRKKHLQLLSEQYGFAIIETDHNHEFCYNIGSTLPVASASIEKNVIYISSVSRLMAPLNLMAFVAGPREFIQSLRGFYNTIYQRGDAILEQAVADMMKSDIIGQYARSSLKIYQHKRDFMAYVLDKNLNKHANYNIPNAGLAFCIQLDAKHDVNTTRKKLITCNIWIPPPELIISGTDIPNILRIGFASLSNYELEKGIEEIANSLK
ncbi:PLP-dependent aminotransferase family protein [Chitinophaga sp. S165]|uniref:aminotransferase-like domain-containing protein n=1 Tax=Chitinophaga sp. S165 TaxID=2135462 RepID=UPI000D70D901|nr:PLP-dependent aminotransferase family protein [Chitinophaga sp. S165]PWV45943.1 GntR family transcriptional regulator/MocR family aminotransferase [Chitinophaga sp. S165]